jgi:hypothetical protein
VEINPDAVVQLIGVTVRRGSAMLPESIDRTVEVDDQQASLAGLYER